MVEPEMIDETLKLARQGLAPTSGERQRLRAAIAARAASAALASGQGAEASLAGWAALKASGKAGLVAGAALLALGFAGGLLLGRERIEPPPVLPAASPLASIGPSAPVPAPLQSVERAPALEAAPAPIAPPPLEAAPRPRAARRPTSSKPSDAFARELALLQRAERAIRNEDPALALSLLAELEREHPRAALGEERRAARVMAHCQAKEPTAALAAERFLRDAPDSVYTDRVRALCGLEGSPLDPR